MRSFGSLLASFGAVVLAGASLAGGARAAVILDANYDPVLTHTAAITTPPPDYYSNEDASQTFRVINTGTIRKIEVRVGRGTLPGGPLLFDLRTTKADGSPSDDTPGAILATGSAPLASITGSFPDYQWIAFDNLNVPTTANTKLAIVLHTDQGGYYGWGCRAPGAYSNGGLFRRAFGASLPTGDLWQETVGFDAAFRVYVNTVPEPISAAGLVIGILFLRRR